jgi:hypothetical protein
MDEEHTYPFRSQMAKVERRDWPKSLGGDRNGAYGASQPHHKGRFWPDLAARSKLGGLPEPLFGQSRKENSAKFALRDDHVGAVCSILVRPFGFSSWGRSSPGY